jgi:hypothetical protein
MKMKTFLKGLIRKYETLESSELINLTHSSWGRDTKIIIQNKL